MSWVVSKSSHSSRHGALISVRDRLKFHPVHAANNSVPTHLAVGHDRRLWTTSRVPQKRRIKAFMKQVVGGVFCGMRNERLEGKIIRELVQKSKTCVDDPMRPGAYNDARMRHALRPILKKLQDLLGSRLRIYLKALVNRLFDREVNLG